MLARQAVEVAIHEPHFTSLLWTSGSSAAVVVVVVVVVGHVAAAPRMSHIAVTVEAVASIAGVTAEEGAVTGSGALTGDDVHRVLTSASSSRLRIFIGFVADWDSPSPTLPCPPLPVPVPSPCREPMSLAGFPTSTVVSVIKSKQTEN